MTKLSVSISALLCLGLMAGTALAQTTTPAPVTTAPATIPAPAPIPTPATMAVPAPVAAPVPAAPAASGPTFATPTLESFHSGYVELTYENYQKLLWRLGKYKDTDQDVVTDFIRVQECGLYKQHVSNDFTWPEVLKSTSAYLKKYAGSFPNKFYVVQPIALDRYDAERGWFTVEPDTQYVNITKLEFANFSVNRLECREGGLPTSVPPLAVMKLSFPFSLTYLPMDAQFAKDFIEYMGRNTKTISIGSNTYARYAFVKFFMTVNDIVTPGNTASEMAAKSTRETFAGRIDGIEVYADQDMTLPLFRWTNTREELEQ